MSLKMKMLLIAVPVILALAAVGVVLYFSMGQNNGEPAPGNEQQEQPKEEPKNESIGFTTPEERKNITTLKTFTSEAAFKAYIDERAMKSAGYMGGFASPMRAVSMDAAVAESAMGAPAPMMKNAEGGSAQVAIPDRVSETNVQVSGIDEPDIVKTDGQRIFASLNNYGWYGRPMPVPMMFKSDAMMGTTAVTEAVPPMEAGVAEMMPAIAPDTGVGSKIGMPYYNNPSKTKILKAFPPAEMAKQGEIEKTGDLLLYKNTLAVFEGNTIYGFDVSDPKAPKEVWKIEMGNNTWTPTARLYGDKLYLIAQHNINRYRPCPFDPFIVKGETITIPCGEIYHPIAPMETDTTYTVSIVEMETGALKNKMTFVGSSSASVIYMSEKFLYVTYRHTGDTVDFFYGFARQNSDIIPVEVTGKIEKLKSYDISAQSKLNELSYVMDQFVGSLQNQDERLKLENEMRNRMEKYFADHKRELELTGIVKISTDDLAMKASGEVPGILLNQFSLDEYEGYLRTAVTVGTGGIYVGNFGGGSRATANDVYVLDADMKIVGSVKDLGLEERIYSARFVMDKAYIVTFRQTDPFYVIDLSSPDNPRLAGELKIPGYSSYLHPISEERVVGVGKEDSNVKVSLFNVRDPNVPTEVAKYTLTEYWSEILNTHHAFLIDKKHNAFFMPGGNAGYIFSYRDDKLEMVKAVSDIQAKRALFINDFLYVVGDNKIVVLDESNWERVKDFDLQ